MTSTPAARNRRIELGVSDLAIRLGTWLVTQSQGGLADPIDDTPLKAAFADVEDRALVEAIAELKAEGCLSTTALMNTALPRMRATLDLFATFDPIAEIGDPVMDSLALVEIALQGEGLEDLSLPMLAVGASGLMNAVGNLAPDKISALYEKTASGDLAAAKALHYELFELNQSVFFDTNPIPIKYMMKRLGIRAPLADGAGDAGARQAPRRRARARRAARFC